MPIAAYTFAFLCMNVAQETMWFTAFRQIFPSKLSLLHYYTLVVALNIGISLLAFYPLAPYTEIRIALFNSSSPRKAIAEALGCSVHIHHHSAYGNDNVFAGTGVLLAHTAPGSLPPEVDFVLCSISCYAGILSTFAGAGFSFFREKE